LYIIIVTHLNPFSMKSIRFESVLSILALFLSMSTYAQVGVGTTNPDASAILELNSTNKGFLPPRMTAYPSSPAIGLTIYRTDLNGYYTWNGSAWTQNVFGTSSSTLNSATITASAYTLTLSDNIINLTTLSNQTLTLPSASTATGKVFWIVNTSTTTKNISSYIILNNSSTTKISAQSSIGIVSDGTNWKQFQGSESDNSGGAQVVNHAVKTMYNDQYHTPWQSPWGLLSLTELNIDVPAGKTLQAEYILYGQTTDANVPPTWFKFTGPTFATDYFWAQLSFKNSTNYDTGEEIIQFNSYNNENNGTVFGSQVDTEFPTANAVHPMMLKVNYRNKGASTVTFNISFAGDRSGVTVASLGILAFSSVVYSIY
jgi:hypothetical protein